MAVVMSASASVAVRNVAHDPRKSDNQKINFSEN